MRSTLFGMLLFVWAVLPPALAQNDLTPPDPADWSGVWVAQGTLFSVRVIVEGEELRVEEIQSLGQVWAADTGRIADGVAIIPVRYMGATANLLARLTGDGIAQVEAANCMPQFMVACTLSAGRQATFIRMKPD